jgi:ribosomal protein L37AE/L43A
VSRNHRLLGRLRRRVASAYALACAREQMRHQRLRVPSGVWLCQHCHLVLWDLDAFVLHGRLHAA